MRIDPPSASSTSAPRALANGPGPAASASGAGQAHGFEYDLVVLGGGSGGLACSKEAAKLGKKVACLDFVKPTPTGTQWGLGGTCVNVGCIPKKLFHQASLLGDSFSDAHAFGWNLPQHPPPAIDWMKLVTGVQDYIGSLNWGYRVQLRDASVKYLNALGKFVGPNTVHCTDRRGQVTTVTADKFVIAGGGRPRYLGVAGDRELCVTSDDIFSLPYAPGKTLCVGASYISLETAGFLAGLGFPTCVMARSIFLRGFDQEIAEHIVGHMSRHGVRVIRPALPVRFERNPSAAEETPNAQGVTPSGKIVVTFRMVETGEERQETFDTVVLAVGRTALTQDLGLEAVGVQVDPETRKVLGIHGEQTNVPNIFAIGDVLHLRQELTPVAIKAGTLLARRLFAGSTLQMDYDLVPTTVFTPLEYGCVGMSEEAAIQAYGAPNVEAYISYFKPLEWQVNHEEHNGVMHREDNACYVKLLTNKLDSERVVGLHVVAPNAGEITQGYAVALKMGATKADFDRTVGIHPTISEEFTVLRVTRISGETPYKTGC